MQHDLKCVVVMWGGVQERARDCPVSISSYPPSMYKGFDRGQESNLFAILFVTTDIIYAKSYLFKALLYCGKKHITKFAILAIF